MTEDRLKEIETVSKAHCEYALCISQSILVPELIAEIRRHLLIQVEVTRINQELLAEVRQLRAKGTFILETEETALLRDRGLEEENASLRIEVEETWASYEAAELLWYEKCTSLIKLLREAREYVFRNVKSPYEKVDLAKRIDAIMNNVSNQGEKG